MTHGIYPARHAGYYRRARGGKIKAEPVRVHPARVAHPPCSYGRYKKLAFAVRQSAAAVNYRRRGIKLEKLYGVFPVSVTDYIYPALCAKLCYALRGVKALCRKRSYLFRRKAERIQKFFFRAVHGLRRAQFCKQFARRRIAVRITQRKPDAVKFFGVRHIRHPYTAYTL